MKGVNQPARMMYHNAYRHLRLGDERKSGGIWDLISQEAERAADYAYQACDYEFAGWINRRRNNEFHHLRAIKGYLEDLPF